MFFTKIKISTKSIESLPSTPVLDSWIPVRKDHAGGSWTMRQSMGIKLISLSQEHLEYQASFIQRLHDAIVEKSKPSGISVIYYLQHVHALFFTDTHTHTHSLSLEISLSLSSVTLEK
jgi:hypothetical protein